MKLQRINKGNIGLAFNNGDFKSVLKPGKYWLWQNQQVLLYRTNEEFNPPVDLSILLTNTDLQNDLKVVKVKDGELVIVLKNELFYKVLESGEYAFWNMDNDYEFIKVNLQDTEVAENINKAFLSKPTLSKHVRVFEVASYEKAILLIDDQYVKTLGQGTYYFWRNMKSIKIGKVDLRQLQLEISGQEILTKDKANIRINFYAQYKVVNIEQALLQNKEYEKQLYTLLQLALRAFVSSYTLDELMEQKNEIVKAIAESVKGQVEQLGVNLMYTGIRDLILPGDMKEIMNQVLIAQKKAQANVIKRREETASTRSLLNTAKLMEDNAMLFKLKEMEYVENIASKIGEITLTGNGNLITELKDIFSVKT